MYKTSQNSENARDNFQKPKVMSSLTYQTYQTKCSSIDYNVKQGNAANPYIYNVCWNQHFCLKKIT